MNINFVLLAQSTISARTAEAVGSPPAPGP
jgi:hypothetical protein